MRIRNKQRTDCVVVVYAAGPGAIQSSPKMTVSILYLYTLIFYLLLTSSEVGITFLFCFNNAMRLHTTRRV